MTDVLDRDWAKRAFLVPDNALEEDFDVKNRYYSSAKNKFTDSRLGCNIGINARYQFNRYSDIRVNGRLGGREEVRISKATGNHGLGRYMSEVYDDNSRCVYLRFGVPQFNSLVNFLRRACDYESAVMVRSGRSVFVGYDIAKSLTTVGLVMAFPVLTIPIAVGAVSEFFFGRPTAKFYTLKPTMFAYWGMVNTIVNIMSVNLGIAPKIFDKEQGRKIGEPVKLDEGYMETLRELYPEMFNPAGMIDVYAIANRAQRLANKVLAEEYDALDAGTNTNWEGYVKNNIYGKEKHSGRLFNYDGTSTFAAFINRTLQFGEWFSSSKDKAEKAEINPALDPDKSENEQKKGSSWGRKYFEYLDSEFRDGSQFAVFRVDETGAVSDSFTNSAVESDLSTKLNSMSSDARQMRFTFADGNLLDGLGNKVAETVTGAIGAVAGAAMDTAAGAAAGLTLGLSNIPLVLSGLGYIDIPKNYQSSTANLARLTYSMDLISPYGNPISQLQDIYIPLAMILAGVLPRSTGEMSYGSPFICSLYDRGRAQIKTGIMESVSIERGITTLPFTRRGNALGIKVTFSVLDLTSMMHMPISSGGIFGSNTTINEDSVIGDYLAVLAGMDLGSQIYPMSKAALNMKKRLAQASRFTSPAWLAGWTKDTTTSGIGQWVTLGTGHMIEAAVRGSELLSGSMR